MVVDDVVRVERRVTLAHPVVALLRSVWSGVPVADRLDTLLWLTSVHQATNRFEMVLLDDPTFIDDGDEVRLVWDDEQPIGFLLATGHEARGQCRRLAEAARRS